MCSQGKAGNDFGKAQFQADSGIGSDQKTIYEKFRNKNELNTGQSLGTGIDYSRLTQENKVKYQRDIQKDINIPEDTQF